MIAGTGVDKVGDGPPALLTSGVTTSAGSFLPRQKPAKRTSRLGGQTRLRVAARLYHGGTRVDLRIREVTEWYIRGTKGGSGPQRLFDWVHVNQESTRIPSEWARSVNVIEMRAAEL